MSYSAEQLDKWATWLDAETSYAITLQTASLFASTAREISLPMQYNGVEINS